MFDLFNGLVATGETTTGFDWSSIDLSGITDGVQDALPVVIPVAVGLMAIPIIWGLIRKMVKKN